MPPGTLAGWQHTMYSPTQDGIERGLQPVRYTEAAPPDSLSGLVHCFWELKTDAELQKDFHLHVLPDACVNLLFDQTDTQIAGITALRTTFEVLNLGKTFHYAGIQFFPGVWQGDPNEIVHSYVGTPYLGDLPLVDTNTRLTNLDFAAQQAIMSELTQQLIDDDIIAANVITEQILTNLDDINSVADMAALTGISTRQLQRTLKRVTGFTPHDLLKVLRLQQSFRRDYLLSYTDQSHFIHSFRKITGYTPEKYAKKFGV